MPGWSSDTINKDRILTDCDILIDEPQEDDMRFVRYVLFHLLRRFATECRPNEQNQFIYNWCRQWSLPIIGPVARLLRDEDKMIYRW
jgi:hypothetical protein